MRDLIQRVRELLWESRTSSIERYFRQRFPSGGGSIGVSVVDVQERRDLWIVRVTETRRRGQVRTTRWEALKTDGPLSFICKYAAENDNEIDTPKEILTIS
jgi:hypothetical protein